MTQSHPLSPHTSVVFSAFLSSSRILTNNEPAGSDAALEGTQLDSRWCDTPIAVHQGQAFTHCDVNCLAHHDDHILNSLTLRHPDLVVPAGMGHNSWSRAMCIAQCYAIPFVREGNIEAIDTIVDSWQLPIESIIEKEITNNYAHNYSAVMDHIVGQDHDPLVIGRLVAHQIAVLSRDDGWNRDGRLWYDPARNGVVLCTANCMSYQDTTGYVSRNPPSNRIGNFTTGDQSMY